MQLDLKTVNDVLEYFSKAQSYHLDVGRINFDDVLKYELIERIYISEHIESQGHEGQTDYVFKITDGIYVKVSILSNSYEEETQVKIKFCKPVVKQVTQYESI